MPATPDFLLSVYLRGGADGLTMACPYDDPDYQSKRDVTRILPPGGGNPDQEAVHLQDASGATPAFGTAPAMAPLKALYDEGKICFVHAAGSIDPTRSHFDQQANTELGTTRDSSLLEATGVWARHLASTPPVGDGTLRGIAILDHMPTILLGAPAVTPAADPATYAFPGDPNTVTGRRSALEDMYTLYGEPLSSSLANSLSTIDALGGVDWDGYVPSNGATYPPTPFGQALVRAAQIAKELPGVEIVHTDRGGWDLHSDEGVFTGTMADNMDDLARGLEAFLRDMEADPRKVVVLVVTEFGRTLDENSSLGTDHGRGGVAIVAGDAVNGGQVLTEWPGLSEPDLDGGDLAVSIDVRDLQGEILLDRLANPDLSQVFTDTNYTYVERGVTS